MMTEHLLWKEGSSRSLGCEAVCLHWPHLVSEAKKIQIPMAYLSSLYAYLSC